MPSLPLALVAPRGGARLGLILTLALVCVVGAYSPSLGAEKSPAPSKEAVAKATEQIKEAYRGEWAKAKTNADKLVIAEEVVKLGIESQGDLPEKFALLSFGRDLASLAGGVDLALKAVDELDSAFVVDVVASRRDLLVAAGKTARATKELGELASKAADVADQAAAGDRFDLAKELSDLALSLARRAANPTLLKEVTARATEMQLRIKDGAAYQAALATLATKPDDPEANLVVGKFRAFVKGDFEAGLPHLAKGSDAALKPLATAELARPTTGAEQTKLADAWLELSEKEKDLRKANLRERAKHWYETALPSLAGILKAKVENRLEEIAKSAEGTPASATPRVAVGGKKTSAKGKIYACGDDKFDLAINGKIVLSGNYKEATLDVELKQGDIVAARVMNAEYENGFSLLFLSDDRRQVFFTNMATWRDFAPPDVGNWPAVKPSPQDGAVKVGHRNSLKLADGIGAGYGVDAIWGFNPQQSYLYHVVNEQDLEVLADPPFKGSKRGAAVAGKIFASGDDMFDLAVNGKPVLSGRNAAEAAAAVELRAGDVITVRVVNSQYDCGFACAFASNDGSIAFYSNAANWVAYQPSDGLRWWKVRGNEPTGPVKPGNARQLVIAPAYAARAANIWWSDARTSGYLLHVVTEQDLKKSK